MCVFRNTLVKARVQNGPQAQERHGSGVCAQSTRGLVPNSPDWPDLAAGSCIPLLSICRKCRSCKTMAELAASRA